MLRLTTVHDKLLPQFLLFVLGHLLEVLQLHRPLFLLLLALRLIRPYDERQRLFFLVDQPHIPRLLVVLDLDLLVEVALEPDLHLVGFLVLEVGWQPDADGIARPEDYLLRHDSVLAEVRFLRGGFFVYFGLEVVDHFWDGLDQLVDLRPLAGTDHLDLFFCVLALGYVEDADLVELSRYCLRLSQGSIVGDD